MAAKLRPFGELSPSYGSGYTLPLLLGHLEGLAADEELIDMAPKGPRARRLDKVQDAMQLLQEAADMGQEEH